MIKSENIRQVIDTVTSLATVVIVAYIAYSMYSAPARNSSAPGVEVGAALPSELVTDNPRIVAIITPTCPYCKASVPAWNELVEAGARLVAYSTFPTSDFARFIEETQPTFPIKHAAGSVIAFELGARSVPYTIVVDEEARVGYVHRGSLQDAGPVLAEVIAMEGGDR